MERPAESGPDSRDTRGRSPQAEIVELEGKDVPGAGAPAEVEKAPSRTSEAALGSREKVDHSKVAGGREPEPQHATADKTNKGGEGDPSVQTTGTKRVLEAGDDMVGEGDSRQQKKDETNGVLVGSEVKGNESSNSNSNTKMGSGLPAEGGKNGGYDAKSTQPIAHLVGRPPGGSISASTSVNTLASGTLTPNRGSTTDKSFAEMTLTTLAQNGHRERNGSYTSNKEFRKRLARHVSDPELFLSQFRMNARAAQRFLALVKEFLVSMTLGSALSLDEEFMYFMTCLGVGKEIIKFKKDDYLFKYTFNRMRVDYNKKIYDSMLSAVNELAPVFLTWPTELEREYMSEMHMKDGFPGCQGVIFPWYFNELYSAQTKMPRPHRALYGNSDGIPQDKAFVVVSPKGRIIYVASGIPGNVPNRVTFQSLSIFRDPAKFLGKSQHLISLCDDENNLLNGDYFKRSKYELKVVERANHLYIRGDPASMTPAQVEESLKPVDVTTLPKRDPVHVAVRVMKQLMGRFPNTLVDRRYTNGNTVNGVRAAQEVNACAIIYNYLRSIDDPTLDRFTI